MTDTTRIDRPKLLMNTSIRGSPGMGQAVPRAPRVVGRDTRQTSCSRITAASNVPAFATTTGAAVPGPVRVRVWDVPEPGPDTAAG